MDADWHAFCQAIYKGIEGKDWEEVYDYYKEMWAAGVRKPNESQNARALWKMKAAKDSGEDFYDPERKDNFLGRNKTRLELLDQHLKDPIVVLDKALNCVESSCWVCSSAENTVVGVISNGLCRLPPKFVGKADLGGRLAPLASDGQCAPYGELFFFLIKKELETMPGSETFGPFFAADIHTPFFSGDVLKKCAPIATHLIAEEGRGGESGCRTPDFGGHVEIRLPAESNVGK